jgi:chromate transporter
MSESFSQRLQTLAAVFLKLGTVGFGGPQAHIALQHEEAVVRRHWLTEDQFTEGLALCEMLPGPASTQMGIYLGYLQAGKIGAIVSGFCFIAPAFLIVLALSWGYFQFQGLPQLDALFLGISPVVTAIVLAFCWTLGKKVLKDWQRCAIAIGVFSLTAFTSMSILFQFLLAGLLGTLWFRSPPPPPNASAVNAPVVTDPSLADVSLQTPRDSFDRFLDSIGTSRIGKLISQIGRFVGRKRSQPLWGVFLVPVFAISSTLSLSPFWGIDRCKTFGLPLALFFLKVGSLIYGGGLVIIPLLEFEVVERFQWLTHTEFINGVAIGQLSPGPVVLTAAFVGYKVAGVLGALIATIAIFLPSFIFIMAAAPVLLRLRHNAKIKAFLQGVTPAVLGAIVAAAIPIAQASLFQPNLADGFLAGVVLGASLFALLTWKTPPWQLVLAGAIVGLLWHYWLGWIF